MRKRAGFIVRFVDVVLILLFGFISISTIRETSLVLPTSDEVILLPPDTEETIYIGIRSDGVFLADEERQVLTHSVALDQYLANVVSKHQSRVPVVHVRAMFDAPMRAVQQAIEVCNRRGLETSLAVRLAGN